MIYEEKFGLRENRWGEWSCGQLGKTKLVMMVCYIGSTGIQCSLPLCTLRLAGLLNCGFGIDSVTWHLTEKCNMTWWGAKSQSLRHLELVHKDAPITMLLSGWYWRVHEGMGGCRSETGASNKDDAIEPERLRHVTQPLPSSTSVPLG